MSDDPITRPGEIGRTARDEIAFRVEVLSGINELKILIKAHSEEDDFRFEQINKRLEGTSSIVSGVASDRDKLYGIKLAIGFFLAAFVVLGGWAIAWWHK